MAKVEFNNVSKRFDDSTEALKDFSLNIENGELVVLVGPSGCGKSTTLRLLAGLEEVSEGEILIDGKVVNQATPQQRNIAMVFQNYALYPHMDVRGNLEFPLRMSNAPKRQIARKVTEIAEILDLSALLTRKPRQLSGGQRQRVAMGRALVRDPSVFLLDEPLSNLDAKLRAQIRADIAKLQKRLNKTTLYVTHDQVEAMTLGDRVAVINNGELQQVGTPEELYDHPHNIFVARFIGSPGMNIVSSLLSGEGSDQIRVRIGGEDIILPAPQPSQDYSSYLNEPVYIGIRPESFFLTPVENSIGINISVVSVEYLGHESLLYLQLSDNGEDQDETHLLIARIAGRFCNTGTQDQTFYIDPHAIYLFDRDGFNIQ